MDFRNVFRRWRRAPAVHTFASMSLASSGGLSVPKSGSSWAQKGWAFYDAVPEVRLVVSYRAAAMSKVILKIAVREGEEVKVVDTLHSNAMLDQLFGGRPYQGAALSRIAQHLTVAGETYLLILVGPDAVDEWLIVPADHVDTAQLQVGPQGPRGQVTITHPMTNARTVLKPGVDNFNLLRVWQPHPHNFWEADSPTRGAIATLDNIMHLNAAIKSTARSRLVGAGILPWPMEGRLDATNPGVPDMLSQQMHEAMTAVRQDPEHPSANAPIVAYLPGELIKNLPEKPISFWSDFDAAVKDLRDAEIRRYATGQPLPTEMVTGAGELNHWTSWHLSEEDLKFDIAPLAQLICDVLTINIIEPIMGKDFLIIPDFADLVSRPNRTPEALEMRDREAITVGELREAAGWPYEFPEGEQPPPVVAVEPQQEPSELTGGRADPPARPDTPDDLDQARFAVADVIARDLVACAGQWVTTHSGRDNRRKLQDVPVLERHVAFAAGSSPVSDVKARVAAKYVGVLPDPEFDRVADYVTSLFENRQEYSQTGLVAFLGASNGHR